MVFTRSLRPRVRSGEITCSVRVWQRPHVKVGGRYAMEEGEIVVTALEAITKKQITKALAVRSGFESVEALMKVAKHGSGEKIFLVEFRYEAPG